MTEEAVCAVCGSSEKQERMIRFSRVEDRIVPDLYGDLMTDEFYICGRDQCLTDLFLSKEQTSELNRDDVRSLIVKSTERHLAKLLGRARKSGHMIIGQQNIRGMKETPRKILFILAASDISVKTVRTLKPAGPVWRSLLTTEKMSGLVGTLRTGVVGFFDSPLSESVRDAMTIINNFAQRSTYADL